MPVILKNEWKSGWKSLLIWALSVGGMGLICIILYKGMEDSMADMAESFATMGTFSDAFGMSTLSIATLKGYFATEIGTIHALGSSMFAASIATVILSKEEDGHTAEYTFTLPVSRGKVIAMKFFAVLLNLICFTLICGLKSVIRTPYELTVNELYEDGSDSDCFMVALDANGNKLPYNDSAGNSNNFTIQDRDISTVDIYILDYTQYMDELKGPDNYNNNENKPEGQKWSDLLDQYAKYHKTLHFD